VVGRKPAELLKAAKGRGPQTRSIAFGDPANGRRGRKAQATKAKVGKPRVRKTAKRTAKKTKAAKSAKAGR